MFIGADLKKNCMLLRENVGALIEHDNEKVLTWYIHFDVILSKELLLDWLPDLYLFMRIHCAIVWGL